LPESLDIDQPDDRPQGGLEPVQGHREPLAAALRGHKFFRCRRGPPGRKCFFKCLLIQISRQGLSPPLHGPGPIATRPDQDGEEPRPLGLGIPQSLKALQSAQSRFLQQILGVSLSPAAEAQRRPVQRIEVLTQEFFAHPLRWVIMPGAYTSRPSSQGHTSFQSGILRLSIRTPERRISFLKKSGAGSEQDFWVAPVPLILSPAVPYLAGRALLLIRVCGIASDWR
jgi:hypothetical protein